MKTIETNQTTHPNNVAIPQFCICLHPGPSGLHLLASPSLGNSSSVFCLPSPVSCILSPVSCILSSTHTPYPALLASCALVPCALPPSVATSQFCKTNPISPTPRSAQLLVSQSVTPIFRPAPLEKTNPNKANPPNAIRHQGPAGRRPFRDLRGDT